MMYILGLSSYVHDSAACIMKDGEIIAAAEEERFNKEKHTNKFPYHSIDFCLKYAGITIDEIDYVGFYWVPWEGIADRAALMLKDVTKLYYFFAGPRQETRGDIKTWFDMLNINRLLKNYFGANDPKYKFIYLNHHLCHAAGAYLASPFKESAILTIDAAGEINSTLMAKGSGNKIDVFKRINYPHSLGMLYLSICPFLGFDENTGAGKIMGLSAYGEPEYIDVFRDILKVDGSGNIRLDMSYFNFQYNNKVLGYHSKKLEGRLGKPRETGAGLEKRHINIAASLQKRLEEVGLEIAKYVRRETGSKNLCLSGGVALNGVLNGMILEEGIFENLYVPPAPNDSGAAMGATFYIYNILLGKDRGPAMTTSYFGPEYTDEECVSALKAANLAYERVDDPGLVGARLLTEKKIIGWFQGRMEFGPRALGNRSILADPRDAEMKDILNSRVKFREYFRPFAPAVLKEFTGEYFEQQHEVPFMSIVFKVREEKKMVIPAVVHVDGTGRLQTVEKDINPRYWSLINEFYKLTGVPVILNTSFNIKGEPMVCTPQDAVSAFLRSDIDCLILGNFLTKK
jgi:carbamoyltransferase